MGRSGDDYAGIYFEMNWEGNMEIPLGLALIAIVYLSIRLRSARRNLTEARSTLAELRKTINENGDSQ
mgnify:CR=1 FL=1